MKKILTLLALFAAFLPGLSAQTKPAPKVQAVLAFFDDETQIVLTDAQGNSMVPAEGMELPVNAIIKTLKTTAEIQIVPNGSIIKLAAATTFSIKSLRDGKSGTNDFSLIGGKIRAVAAKLTGATAPGYNISTPTANCGVRGTDFAMLYDLATQKDWVCVQEGAVDFTNITTGATIPVTANQFANTFDPVFQAGAVDATRLAQIFSDVDFVKLKPAEVPGHLTAETKPETKPEAAPASDAASAPVQPAAAPSQGSNPMLDFLKNFLALEVGSVTINGTTYSKAVLSPTITADKFKLGLYLPIVYTTDMFDPNDWYRPAGNNEWSFGSDKHGLGSQAADFASDLALKIKFLEWGDQANDPFYLKLGNLQTMTLGHGTVVRNFANDQDFPAVRKIGLNAGAKLGGVTLEGLTDDIVQSQVVGGRVAFDLLGDQFVLGFQTAADLHLADKKSLANDTVFGGMSPDDLGDPVLLVGGLDIQFFKIDFGPVFRTHVFSDFNALTSYNRTAFADLDSGLQTDTLWHGGKGSFGTETGFYGNIALVDYRLSFQTEQGLYRNSLFQGDYYRTRNFMLYSLLNYETNAAFRDEVDKTTTMGIFGSAGFNLFGFLTFEGAYRWPFVYRSDGSYGASDNDYLLLGLTVPKGKLPFVKLSGGISYQRSGFASSVRDGVNLFDASSVVSGNVAYGLTDGLDLVLTVTTSAVLDAAGNQVYDSSGKPKVAPTVAIDTRLSF